MGIYGKCVSPALGRGRVHSSGGGGGREVEVGRHHHDKTRTRHIYRTVPSDVITSDGTGIEQKRTQQHAPWIIHLRWMIQDTMEANTTGQGWKFFTKPPDEQRLHYLANLETRT
jgi:hypothetical protein